jgi:hypothetical protein
MTYQKRSLLFTGTSLFLAIFASCGDVTGIVSYIGAEVKMDRAMPVTRAIARNWPRYNGQCLVVGPGAVRHTPVFRDQVTLNVGLKALGFTDEMKSRPAEKQRSTIFEANTSIKANFVEIQLSWGARKVTLGERTTSGLRIARDLV